ncbi:hypothetical protein ACLOJK_031638 [Asimina triloba]
MGSSSSDIHHGSNSTQQRSNTVPDNALPSGLQQSNQVRRGSAGIVGSSMLLKSYQRMHAPYTQEAPIMTEDMHEERLQAMEAFGNAFAWLQHTVSMTLPEPCQLLPCSLNQIICCVVSGFEYLHSLAKPFLFFFAEFIFSLGERYPVFR